MNTARQFSRCVEPPRIERPLTLKEVAEAVATGRGGKPASVGRVRKWISVGVKVRGAKGGRVRLRPTIMPNSGFAVRRSDLEAFLDELTAAYEASHGTGRRPRRAAVTLDTPTLRLAGGPQFRRCPEHQIGTYDGLERGDTRAKHREYHALRNAGARRPGGLSPEPGGSREGSGDRVKDDVGRPGRCVDARGLDS